mmetsp:Transcript_28975/g.70655  ORF Transcript_28975/g.70655 Transcript_28975/m.70655 type:complete len:189 (-) Transcript_28975:241-807(-)
MSDSVEEDIAKILRGALHGVLYGAKVRAPHAFVMTLLFRRDLPLLTQLKTVLKLTLTHAKNLGFYVFVYKSILLFLKHMTSLRIGSRALIAGGIGGSIVFGDTNSVNTQINLYVFSRVALALGKLASEKIELLTRFKHGRRVWAGASWALVMYLFVEYRRAVQRSLVNSMVYLYEDSDISGKTFANLL